MTTMNTRTAARPIADVLAWSKGLFDPALRTSTERLPATMRRISEVMTMPSASPVVVCATPTE